MSRDHLGPPVDDFEAAFDALNRLNGSMAPHRLSRLFTELSDAQSDHIKARGTELRRGIAEVAEAEGRN